MRIRVVLTWKRLAALAVVGVLGALLVGWSGLVSIAASSGHFAVTRWYLGWTMENAVETQSMLVGQPEDVDLDDPALVQRAAGHYATGCAPCHGAPGVPQSPVVHAMTPSPPRLEEKVGEWGDEELFWIVKHGIKYSGMPAWPTQERDDEVWAQVAFLRALPGLTRTEYADLALGGARVEHDLEAGGETTAALDGVVEEALQDCARCHGRDGLGRGEGEAADAFPVIAGQPAPYLYATLRAFALGLRESGFMEPPAERYDPEVLEALARHYAEQPVPAVVPGDTAGVVPLVGANVSTTSDPADAALAFKSWQDEAGLLEGEGDLAYAAVPMAAASGPPEVEENMLMLGRRIALEGFSSRKVPACQSCHGRDSRERNPFYPRLAGQPRWYLAKHLRLWKEGERGGTPFAHVMDEIARNMTEEQIDAVAAWYASAGPSASAER